MLYFTHCPIKLQSVSLLFFLFFLQIKDSLSCKKKKERKKNGLLYVNILPKNKCKHPL